MPLAPLSPPKGVALNLWRGLKGSVFFGLLLVLIFICNIAQMLSAPLLLISRRAVRAVNRLAGGAWWATCDLLSQHMLGIDVVMSGDDPPPLENVMVTANHQSMSDVPSLFRLARRKGRIGDLKWFVKESLKYVPGLGWGMVLLDCVFLKRDWRRDEPRVRAQLARFRDERIPIWTLSFVEGTRVRPKKLAAAAEYASSRGLAPLTHLIFPRTKGFTLTVDALRDHLDAVYDATIGYEGGVPSIKQWCRGDVRRVHVYVRRFPISSLPQGEEALAEWLRARWYEKDALLDHFYREGRWPTPPNS